MWAVVEWRSVVGFEGLYEVSSDGRVRGLTVRRERRVTINPFGYQTIQLWRDNRGHMFMVHRIVAAAFIGPLPDGKEVNHIDGDKGNNGVANLEYVTRSQNMIHAYDTGLRKANQTAAAASRRKPRIIISCGCGCGQQVETPDRKGRERRMVHGHSFIERHKESKCSL